MSLKETGERIKVSELLKQLNGTYQGVDSKEEESIRRLADLYKIDTRYKRIDKIKIEVQQEEERRANELASKHIIN